MTGPEHYKEAERLISSVTMLSPRNTWSQKRALLRLLALAQVHATLALAAEIALPWSTDGPAA